MTKARQDVAALQVVGIVQEQHPDRARLFMQWKQMQWPVLVDALDLLDVAVVPITVLIDEAGTVRKIQPRPRDLEAFLAEAPADASPAPPASRPDLPALRAATAGDEPVAVRDGADGLIMWGDDADLDRAVAAYERTLVLDPNDGRAHFRLGVAFRRRFESSQRRDGDFARAIEHWRAALAVDPNQYIWRRRIQQYGPRLDKPYPFYDWVNTARADIEARGDTPVRLAVEPSGAELARPQRAFRSASAATSPDPDGRIHRDEDGLIDVETVVVPHTRGGRGAFRVHVTMRPSTSAVGHWNNETGEGLAFWIDPPAGWSADRRLHTVAPGAGAVSNEPRRVELELKAPDDAAAGSVTIPAYALYYVCQGADGLCLYRRRDLAITIDLR
ncbi:MAG: hypothetical protein ACYTJ0_12065 [Planctomycetota bacterium]|jgi:hypothetical protein